MDIEEYSALEPGSYFWYDITESVNARKIYKVIRRGVVTDSNTTYVRGESPCGSVRFLALSQIGRAAVATQDEYRAVLAGMGLIDPNDMGDVQWTRYLTGDLFDRVRTGTCLRNMNTGLVYRVAAREIVPPGTANPVWIFGNQHPSVPTLKLHVLRINNRGGTTITKRSIVEDARYERQVVPVSCYTAEVDDMAQSQRREWTTASAMEPPVNASAIPTSGTVSNNDPSWNAATIDWQAAHLRDVGSRRATTSTPSDSNWFKKRDPKREESRLIADDKAKCDELKGKRFIL